MIYYVATCQSECLSQTTNTSTNSRVVSNHCVVNRKEKCPSLPLATTWCRPDGRKMTQAALLPTRARDECGTLLILSSKSSRQYTGCAVNLYRLSIVALEKATDYLLPGLSLVTRLELVAQLLQKTLRPGNNVTTVPTTSMWQTSPGFNPLGAIWFL